VASDPSSLKLHEITTLRDPHLLDWLDLYESAFPPHGRGAVSWIIRALQAREEGRPTHSRLWILCDGAGDFTGMAQTSWNEPYRLTYLGYFAILPERRGQGLGASFYRLLLPHILTPGPDFLLFDVERPDLLPNPADRELAARRIRFYERLGARVLPGATFAWGQARQRLMYHLFAPINEAQILRRATDLVSNFGGRLMKDDDCESEGTHARHER